MRLYIAKSSRCIMAFRKTGRFKHFLNKIEIFQIRKSKLNENYYYYIEKVYFYTTHSRICLMEVVQNNKFLFSK